MRGILITIWIGLALRGTYTASFEIYSGYDASRAGVIDTLPVFSLETSDNTRYNSLNPWPESTAYNEEKYIEFEFNPSIPLTASIDSFRIIHEYSVDQIPGGMNAKLEIYRGSDGSWIDIEISTPQIALVDMVDTLNLDTLITTPADVNDLKIRFLTYATDTIPYFTLHDNLKLLVFTPSSLYVCTPYGGVDRSDGTEQPFPENLMRRSDDLGYGSAFWPQQPDYDETRYIEFCLKPNIPPGRTVIETKVVHEWRPNRVLDSTYAKLEIYKNSTGVWQNYPLSVPTVQGVDVTDTIDLSSFINTPGDVNNIRIKFLAYTPLTGPSEKFKSFHDFLSLYSTYSTLLNVEWASLAPDTVRPGDVDVPMLKLSLSTDTGWARIESIRVENRAVSGNVSSVSYTHLTLPTKA